MILFIDPLTAPQPVPVHSLKNASVPSALCAAARFRLLAACVAAASAIIAAPVLAASNIDTAQPFYLGSGIGTSVNPVFQGGTLRMNVPNGTYPQNFTLDGSATNTINQDGNTSTFSGVFSNANAAVPGNLTIANSGTGGLVTFTGLSTYSGATTIDTGATLALSGSSLIFGSNGNIATSSGVVDNGTFDISNIKTVTLVPELGDNLIGLTVPTLSGTGALVMGLSYLKLTNAAGTYSGVITGTEYPLIIAGGTETLSAASPFSGSVYVDSGATLKMAGAGSIAAGQFQNRGVFDISATDSGTTVLALLDPGQVVLGDKTLTVGNSAGGGGGEIGGIISGTGGITVIGGTAEVSSINTYSGATTIGPNAWIGMLGNGSIAASSGVLDAGTFDISSPAADVSVTTLAGTGRVFLGNNTLNLTGANTTFAGVVAGTFGFPFTVYGGTGGLTVSGGTQTLSGNNTYIGPTTIEPGATLALIGSGSVSASSGIAANGTFDIAGTTNGTMISTLSGTGTVALGTNGLTLTNANTAFSGTITGTGNITVSGGIEALTSTNTFSGGASVIGATLAVNADTALGAPAGVLTLVNGSLTALAPLNSGSRTVMVAGNGTINTNLNAVGLSGPIGGSGGLIVSGGGLLTLSGTNSYSAGTRITGGTVLSVGSDAALGAPTGPLIFDDGTLSALASFSSSRPVIATTAGGIIDTNGFTLSFSGPLTLDGPLDWTGTGEVLFTSSITTNMPITVANTYSANNGTLTAPSLTVTPTGTLRGTGTINAPTTVFGTLAPGNSPGTLTFTAPLTLAPGSTTQLDIDGTGTGTGAGNYSRILVTGAANTITLGGTLQPLLRGITGSASNSYTPPIGQTFAVITADGGISGGYSGLTQPTGLAPGTRFDALYGANTLTLVVTPNTYGNLTLAGLSESATDAAVGRALDAIRPAAGISNT